MIYHIVLLFALLVSLTYCQLNDRPIIGVWTQPSSSSDEGCDGSCDYLAASYVKWIESSGGQVVPIPYGISSDEVDFLFDRINGVLFTGGGAAMPDGAKRMLNKAIDANKQGDFFPLWGTCLGFEWLLMGVSGNDNILDCGFDSENISLPLDYTEEAKGSKFLKAAGPHLALTMAKRPFTMNNHGCGIKPDHFDETPELTSFFKVLSTNEDRQGVSFVSTIESPEYPIQGVQWHPEKNSFEWGYDSNGEPYEAIDHSMEAVQVTQFTSNYLVNMARKNFHAFDDSDQETSYLIYNYQVHYTPPEFIQKYYFHWE